MNIHEFHGKHHWTSPTFELELDNYARCLNCGENKTAWLNQVALCEQM